MYDPNLMDYSSIFKNPKISLSNGKNLEVKPKTNIQKSQV